MSDITPKKESRLSKKAKIKQADANALHHPAPLIVPRSAHNISRGDISEYALKVLYRLHKNNYKAYLVGGGVRDLLLGKHPKDFDVVTDATPEQIRKVFSNCRLIGRRFRLAHVYFGRDIVEVATFRALQTEEDSGITIDNAGMIIRDNTYGDLEQDAWRRDFTINALYYNIADFSLVDYTGGLADLNNRVLRMIGDPEQRFREDPVRMLRALRFSGKLGLALPEDLGQAIKEHASLLENISSSRLFEEDLKIFHSGAVSNIYHMLHEYDLFDKLFQLTGHALKKNSPTFEKLIQIVLDSTDDRIKEGKSVAPGFLFVTLLWQPMCHLIEKYLKLGTHIVTARTQAMDEILALQGIQCSIPRRISHMIKEVWNLQFRFDTRHPRKVERILAEPRFRAGYDFLVFRAQAGEKVQDLADWWTRYYEGTPQVKKELTKAFSHKGQKHKKTKLKKPKNSTPNSPFSES